MDFGKRRKSKRSIGAFQSTYSTYPLLMMYNKKPPTEEIPLEEFERFAIDRLKRMSNVL